MTLVVKEDLSGILQEGQCLQVTWAGPQDDHILLEIVHITARSICRLTAPLTRLSLHFQHGQMKSVHLGTEEYVNCSRPHLIILLLPIEFMNYEN